MFDCSGNSSEIEKVATKDFLFYFCLFCVKGVNQEEHQKAVIWSGPDSSYSSARTRRFSMFYQNYSPEVVRRSNGMEFHRNGFCRESKEESSLKVTLLGYKVVEEKTKFTVYKILVERVPDQNWIIFRRYTDFSQLHDKLKEMFPVFNLSLPPKRWFNNFSAEFLEERRQGLQEFLEYLVANKDVINSEEVRGFLCLDETPTTLDGLEERAFCETDCHLQRAIMHNKCETLRNFLLHKELQISSPERTIIGTHRYQNGLNMLSKDLPANGDLNGEHEYREVEKDDPSRPYKSSGLQFIRGHSACWCGSATDSSLTNIQKNKDLEDHSKNSVK